VGDVYKLYGIKTIAFKDYPLNDERVEVMEKEDNGVLTLKVIDPMKFGPVVTGRDWEYKKGAPMYISVKDDGDRIYLTPVKKEDVTENTDKKKSPCWKGYEAIGMKTKDGKKVPNCVPIKENEDNTRYMFFSNLQQMKRQCEYLLEFNENEIEEILENGHDWAQDHIAEAKNNMDQVFDFFMNEIKGDTTEPQTENINEAEYKGRKVTLNKPFYTPDGPKKRSVYVKNDKGNVVKVNFGDPDMEIKRDDPERRKSFRARHGCDQKKDKTTPGYWSCKAW
jgi:hypothetical protein